MLGLKNILALVGLLVVAFVGVGWYLGWYEIGHHKDAQGRNQLKIEVDATQITEDLNKGKEHVTQILENQHNTVPSGPPLPPLPPAPNQSTQAFPGPAGSDGGILPRAPVQGNQVNPVPPGGELVFPPLPPGPPPLPPLPPDKSKGTGSWLIPW